MPPSPLVLLPFTLASLMTYTRSSGSTKTEIRSYINFNERNHAMAQRVEMERGGRAMIYTIIIKSGRVLLCRHKSHQENPLQ
jgi:hypothetical protein